MCLRRDGRGLPYIKVDQKEGGVLVDPRDKGKGFPLDHVFEKQPNMRPEFHVKDSESEHVDPC